MQMNEFSIVYLGGTTIVGRVRTRVRPPCAIGTGNYLVWTYGISLLLPLEDRNTQHVQSMQIEAIAGECDGISNMGYIES